MFVTKMRTLAALVLALATVVGGAGGLTYHLLSAGAAQKTDKDAIQGTWKVVGVEADGKDVSGEEGEGKMYARSSWTITADKMVAQSDDKVLELKYTLDPGKTPKALDFTVLQGPVPETKGASWRAVYSLEGATLKICQPFDPEAERPVEVGTKEGSKTLLIVLERAKK